MTRSAQSTELLFEPLLTPKEAAAAIGVCEDTLRSLVRAGELRFINVGTGKRRKLYRFAPSDLQELRDRGAPKPRWSAEEYANAEGLPWPLPAQKVVARAQGLIYFVGYGQFVKIGFATDLALRLTALQVSTPHPLKVYLKIEGTLEDEKALHRQFAAYRIRGEWFRRSSEIKAWIVERRSAV